MFYNTVLLHYSLRRRTKKKSKESTLSKDLSTIRNQAFRKQQENIKLNFPTTIRNKKDHKIKQQLQESKDKVGLLSTMVNNLTPNSKNRLNQSMAESVLSLIGRCGLKSRQDQMKLEMLFESYSLKDQL